MTWSAVAVFVMAIVWALTLAHGDGGASVLDGVGFLLTSLLAAATAVVVLHLLAGAIDPPASLVLLVFQYCVGIVPAIWVMLTLSAAVMGEASDPPAPAPALVAIATIGIITSHHFGSCRVAIAAIGINVAMNGCA